MDDATYSAFDPPVRDSNPLELDDAVTAVPSDALDSPQGDDAVAAADCDRRMCMRAYNHWAGLLNGRDCPTLDDLDPGTITEFAGNSLLLGFSADNTDPEILYCGPSVRQISPNGGMYDRLSEAPSDSLIGRLSARCSATTHRHVPVGWDGRFIGGDGAPRFGRAILLPLGSRAGGAVDMIYCVVSWREWREGDDTPTPTLPTIEPEAPHSAWQDGPQSDEGAASDVLVDGPATPAAAPAEPGRIVIDQPDDPLEPEVVTAADPLEAQLIAARQSAEHCRAADSRSRAALYRALSLAYDFALAGQADPARFMTLTDEAGIKIQARAPMTAVAKLVFGADYDKTRLTEFSAALSLAQRRGIGAGGFFAFIDSQAGGLKALVAEQRRERRPAQPRTPPALDRLRSAPQLSLDNLSTNGEFALIVTRRGADGRHQPIRLVIDEALLERALRLAAQ